jgi:hypothetical protein
LKRDEEAAFWAESKANAWDSNLKWIFEMDCFRIAFLPSLCFAEANVSKERKRLMDKRETVLKSKKREICELDIYAFFAMQKQVE